MNDRLPATTPIRAGKVRSTPKGRRVDPQALADVRTLLGDAPRRRDLLIEHLHRIQDRFGCLSDRHLVALADEMKLAPTEVYEVATFYHHFDVVKDGVAAPPAITVRVCDSIACELAGAQGLLERLPKLLGPDVRVLAAPCIGRCEQAPAATVGQHPVACATAARIEALVRRRDVRHPAAKDTARFDPAACVDPKNTPGVVLEASPAYVGYDAYRAAGGYRLLADCLAGKHSPEQLIETMEQSGLRGLGGAGFPTGRKWKIVRAEPQPKVVALNIDEGEPGTFKDRVYLERDPHRFLEGMLVAAWVVQAGACYVYLRDEYHGCRAILERELARLRADPPCALPLIELRRGAGAYICGEETALLESIEGKRGTVRPKPPLPAIEGLFGQPTVINNVISLASVPIILDKGGAYYKDYGMGRSLGTLPIQLTGNIARGGLIEKAFGVTLRELLYEYGGGSASGRPIRAVQVGGPLGAYLPESQFDTPLDYEAFAALGAVLGHGGIVVFDDSVDMADMARYAMEFCAVESCGKCTPCRIGSTRGEELLEQIIVARSEGPQPGRIELLKSLCDTMLGASLCALGYLSGPECDAPAGGTP